MQHNFIWTLIIPKCLNWPSCSCHPCPSIKVASLQHNRVFFLTAAAQQIVLCSADKPILWTWRDDLVSPVQACRAQSSLIHTKQSVQIKDGSATCEYTSPFFETSYALHWSIHNEAYVVYAFGQTQFFYIYSVDRQVGRCICRLWKTHGTDWLSQQNPLTDKWIAVRQLKYTHTHEHTQTCRQSHGHQSKAMIHTPTQKTHIFDYACTDDADHMMQTQCLDA